VEVETATYALGQATHLILCSDGLWDVVGEAALAAAVVEEADFETLADRLVHRQVLLAELGATFRTYPAAWWLQQLTQAQVPCGRFQTYDEMCQHPQVRLNGLMTELPTAHWGTIRVAGLPWAFGLTPGVQRPGPMPGSDTAAVLSELLGDDRA